MYQGKYIQLYYASYIWMIINQGIGGDQYDSMHYQSICFLGSIIYLQESVRYQLNKGQFQLAFQEINYISELNQGFNFQRISDEDKDQLIKWQQNQNITNQTNNTKTQNLLSDQYLSITIKLWLIVGLINYQNMSIYLLLPLLFQHANSGFGSMLWLYIVELLFSGIIYHFIDNQRHGGRIRIVIYSAYLLIVTNLLLYIWQNQFLFIGMILIKLATRAVFSLSYIITCESYPLILRSRGAGLAQGVGKLMALPAPYVIFPLFYIDPYLPFALMTILAIFMAIVACIYPVDRTQKHLEITSDQQRNI